MDERERREREIHRRHYLLDKTAVRRRRLENAVSEGQPRRAARLSRPQMVACIDKLEEIADIYLVHRRLESPTPPSEVRLGLLKVEQHLGRLLRTLDHAPKQRLVLEGLIAREMRARASPRPRPKKRGAQIDDAFGSEAAALLGWLGDLRELARHGAELARRAITQQRSRRVPRGAKRAAILRLAKAYGDCFQRPFGISKNGPGVRFVIAFFDALSDPISASTVRHVWRTRGKKAGGRDGRGGVQNQLCS